MKIPNGASICPYCRSKVQGFGMFGDFYDDFKEGYQKTNSSLNNLANGSSSNGCMVILPLIVVFAASAFYLINTLV